MLQDPGNFRPSDVSLGLPGTADPLLVSKRAISKNKQRPVNWVPNVLCVNYMIRCGVAAHAPEEACIQFPENIAELIASAKIQLRPEGVIRILHMSICSVGVCCVLAPSWLVGEMASAWLMCHVTGRPYPLGPGYVPRENSARFPARFPAMFPATFPAVNKDSCHTLEFTGNSHLGCLFVTAKPPLEPTWARPWDARWNSPCDPKKGLTKIFAQAFFTHDDMLVWVLPMEQNSTTDTHEDAENGIKAVKNRLRTNVLRKQSR